MKQVYNPNCNQISIHSPHTGRDATCNHGRKPTKQFQSTLPTRGETWSFQVSGRLDVISIHSPHTGRDGPVRAARPWGSGFQSTLPTRGETMQSKTKK